MCSQLFVCPREAGRRGLYPSMQDQHSGGSASGGGEGFCLQGVCIIGGGGGLGGWAYPSPPELEKQAVRILLECFLILCLQVEVEAAAEVEVRLVVGVVAAEEEAEVRHIVIPKKFVKNYLRISQLFH